MTDEEQKLDELLPCPFCGGEAIYGDAGWGKGMHIILCNTRIFGCRLCPRIHYMEEDISKAMMFKIWNRRATGSKEVELQAEVEKLREALDFYADPSNRGLKKMGTFQGGLVVCDALLMDNGKIAKQALKKERKHDRRGADARYIRLVSEYVN